MGSILSLLHSDLFLKIAAPTVAIAAVGVVYLPQNTVGFKVCTGIVAAGAALGISSTTSRATKVKPVVAPVAAPPDQG